MIRPKHVHFDRKVSLVLSENLPTSTALVVLAHVAVSLGAHGESIVGQQITDLSGIDHRALCKYPVAVLEASPAILASIVTRSKERAICVVDFPRQALDLWTDDELVRDIQRRHADDLEYLGCALVGEPREINKLTGSLKLFGKRS